MSGSNLSVQVPTACKRNHVIEREVVAVCVVQGQVYLQVADSAQWTPACSLCLPM